MKTVIAEACAFVSIIIAIFTGEYFLKNHIEENENFETKRPIICGLVYLRKYHNYGAALDTGDQYPQFIRFLSVLLTGLASIAFAMTLGQKGTRLLKFGLSLLLGGAYSNTYDRIKRHYVVDYFSFPVKNSFLRNLVFNLSDFCIIIGALMWALGYSAE